MVAIVLAAGLKASAEAAPKANPMRMSSFEITSAQLLTQRGAVRETIDITRREVRFSSEDERDSKLPTLGFAWPEAYLLASIAETLRPLRDGEFAKNGKYYHRLIVATGGVPSVNLSWDTASESPDLRRIRESIQRAANLRADEAKRASAEGEAARQGGAVDQAISCFKRGLRLLGDLYWAPDSVDHTGQKIVAGQVAEGSGQNEQAAAIYHRVLETRLKSYDARHGVGAP
jgi:tetratricopeptide (TPR) repeat protein